MPRFHLLVAILLTVATLGLAPSAAAHYNPTKGRWIERDPIGYRDGTSLYQFASGQPASKLDSDGRSTHEPPGWLPIDAPPGMLPVIPTRPAATEFERPGPITRCTLAIRCGEVHKSGFRVGTHCGLIICDDWGCQALDGSGGSTNRWELETPPRKWGTTGPAIAVPSSVCDCLRSRAKRWNLLRVKRDHFDRNSNWSLRCLLDGCGYTVDWGGSSPPQGWNCSRCVEWSMDPTHVTQDAGYEYCFRCVKSEPCPCP